MEFHYKISGVYEEFFESTTPRGTACIRNYFPAAAFSTATVDKYPFVFLSVPQSCSMVIALCPLISPWQLSTMIPPPDSEPERTQRCPFDSELTEPANWDQIRLTKQMLLINDSTENAVSLSSSCTCRRRNGHCRIYEMAASKDMFCFTQFVAVLFGIIPILMV